MRRPKNYKVATRTLDTEVIVIDTDTDTDEVGGRMLALCGEVNASRELVNTLTEDGERNRPNMPIVCADDSHSSWDNDYMKFLANCTEGHLYFLEENMRNTSPMRLSFGVDKESDRRKGRPVKTEKIRAERKSKSPSNAIVSKRLMTENGRAGRKLIPVRKESIAGRKAKSPLISSVSKKWEIENGKADHKSVSVKKEKRRAGRKPKSPSIFSASKKLEIENGRVDHKLISVNREKRKTGRKPKPPSIPTVSKKLETENGRTDHKLISVNREKRGTGRKPKPPSLSSVSKRLKTENDRAGHKLITVKKEKSRAERKSKPPSVSSGSKRLKTENSRADHKLISWTVYRTKETQLKTPDACQGMRKTWKEENKESSARRNVESKMIFRASKRLKTENESAYYNSISRTIPVVNAKDTQQKKGEDPQGRKILVTKKRVESKSKSHGKDNILDSFKARKKVNEEGLSSLERSYAYYLSYLRNSITIFKADQPVKPVKDLVCLSDPDIIAVSNHPFSDGGNIPFETNKDDTVIDLEDGMVSENLFNSLYSKNLVEVLSKPYDEKECLKLYYEVKLKRPLTRSRQLRDGKEIEYNVNDQLGHSYLEWYTDFKKKFRRHRRDRPRALNLLRGLFFYFENISRVGAFKPWVYEKHLENMCFDARGCKDLECIEAAPHCS